jgi:hypothetical protein
VNRGLVFYERSSDFTEFYSANGGSMNRVGGQPASGRQWAQIVPGTYWGSLYAGLLFYEASTGTVYFCMPVRAGQYFSLMAFPDKGSGLSDLPYRSKLLLSRGRQVHRRGDDLSNRASCPGLHSRAGSTILRRIQHEREG